MAPLLLSASSLASVGLHLPLSLQRRCDDLTSSLCKPASSRANLIIGVVFGVVMLLILLLAFWYYGCLCCWSRKAAQKKKDGYNKVEEGESGPTIWAGSIAVDTSAGTSYTGGGGGGGGSSLNIAGDGGGGGGVDCVVM